MVRGREAEEQHRKKVHARVPTPRKASHRDPARHHGVGDPRRKCL